MKESADVPHGYVDGGCGAGVHEMFWPEIAAELLFSSLSDLRDFIRT
jgi:hypothetical protein